MAWRALFDKVEKNLLDLVRVHHRFGQVWGKMGNRLDVAGAHLVLENFHGAFHQFIDVGELALGFDAAGKLSKLCTFFAALRAPYDHVQVTLSRRGPRRSPLSSSEKPMTEVERICSLMRHAGDKFAMPESFRFESLRLSRLSVSR